MNEGPLDDIVALLKEQLHFFGDEPSASTRLREDCGLEGRRAAFFMASFGERFAVDMTRFFIVRHFDYDESRWRLLCLKTFNSAKAHRYPITLADLARAAAAGRWIYDYPPEEFRGEEEERWLAAHPDFFKDDALYEEVLAFVKEQWGVEKGANLATTLHDDYGMDGEDAYEFMVAFGRRFKVSLKKFYFQRHFYDEGLWAPSTGPLYPLAIGDLVQAAAAGRWIYDYPPDEKRGKQDEEKAETKWLAAHPGTVKNEALLEAVAAFLDETVIFLQREPSLALTLADCYGLEGDEARRFMTAFAAHFTVDMTDFHFVRHFDDPEPWWQRRLRKLFTPDAARRYPIALGDLVRSVEAGRWDYDYPWHERREDPR